MFYLFTRHGVKKGTLWPIGVQPIILGRAETCDIVIPDLIVSRRHCEIVAVDSVIHLRDLGSANATCVNDRLVVDAVLKEGDEITIGGSVLVVVRMTQDALAATHTHSLPASDTTSLVKVHSLSSEDKDLVRAHLPQGVADLQDIYLLSRLFSHASSIGDIVSIFEQHLRERFAPEGVWIAWYLGGERRLVPYPRDNSADSLGDPPLEDMLKAIDANTGMLVPGRMPGGKPYRFVTTLVAPFIVAGEPLGAAAVRKATPNTVYDEADLEYFFAVAHAMSPHLRATAHYEQLQRDLEQARRLAGVLPGLLGDGESMVALRKLIATVAASHLHVLILGETGTGKELAARMIHDLSDRADHPFIVVNCAAIPRDLFESQFFGYEENAFTGAGAARAGLFEEAHSGTLFLDEVGDLSPEHQARILRAIETGTFHRVGSTKETRVDVRVVAATNKLEGPPEPGSSFRSDLYHRLSGFTIFMPPLRDHLEDLPLLVEQFLRELHGLSGLRTGRFRPQASEKLRGWLWPGNVRELRACVHRAAALAQGEPIGPEHIVLTAPTGNAHAGVGQVLTLSEAEKHHITLMFRRMNGNVSATARALQISRDTLYNKLKEYGING